MPTATYAEPTGHPEPPRRATAHGVTPTAPTTRPSHRASWRSATAVVTGVAFAAEAGRASPDR
jgi:hypothetical protein